MVTTGVLFVGVTGVVRYLGTDMSAVQAAFLRYLFGTLMMLPLLARVWRTERGPRRLGLHALRGSVHAVGVMLWFFAMARIPIADVTAIGFTTPVFTTIGAVLFLRERFSPRHAVAVAVAFAGTVVVLRPGLQAIEAGALAQLAAAPLFACSFLVAKKLTETESGVAIVAWLSVFVTLALAPFALADWRTPTPWELLWLLVTAGLATAGHYTLTHALRACPITVLQPFTFLQLVWATALGFLAFAEVPDPWTLAGGALIVAAATYIVRSEARRGIGR
ncbi:MAG: DMT family transporter [Ectothiorhodospiraceae bacterium]|nr:DMT family transporter [Chromatiales bacterium]MCP5156981.1 DMT family transporter [Ectothiorhodospiraceae bacterium]